MKPTLYTATGECVTPSRELGKGGEGAVYDIEEFVDSVAKIYHTPPPALKQDKPGRRQRFTVDEAEKLSVL